MSASSSRSEGRGRAPAPAPAPALAALGLGLALALVVGGCGHKIGDACSSSADCDPSGGNRTCDLSQPGGYCIIEGCDARSCPEDSVCVRFFPEQPLLDPTKVCVPARASECGDPNMPPPADVCCDPGEVCLPHVGDPAATGACVRTSLEKRACVQSCGGNGDCRGGYLCRTAGTCGTLGLVLDPKGTPKFCAPTPVASTGALALCSI